MHLGKKFLAAIFSAIVYSGAEINNQGHLPEWEVQKRQQGMFPSKDKSGVGITVDYSTDKTFVNGV